MKLNKILIVFALSFMALVGNAQVQEKSIFRNGDLEITFVTNFTRIWSDAGSGANQNGAFFRPVLTNMQGFHSLGDLSVRSHSSAGQIMAVVRDMSDSGNILVAPLSYTRLWTDAGSGANQDGSVWRPNPPAGYVAIGLVANSGYNAPSLNAMRCIKEEYVIQGVISTNAIWSDVGSGANQDFSSWGILSPQVSAGSGKIYLAANTFIGHASHNKPANTNANLYALILPIQEELPIDTVFPELPVLTSFNQPPLYSANGTLATTYLPWFSVNDPQLTMLEKIAQSPTYKMVRETRYRRINFTHNQSSQVVTMNWSTTFGTSVSKTKAYSQTTGIEMTAGWGGMGVSASISLSLSFTHTNETTSHWSEETSTSIDVPVPSNTASAAYLLESTYKLYRENGSIVGTELDHRPNGSFYVTSYTDDQTSVPLYSNNQLMVYPVPTGINETIHLVLPFQQLYRVLVCDATGKVVLDKYNQAEHFTIEANTLHGGVYIIQVVGVEGQLQKKIIVQ